MKRIITTLLIIAGFLAAPIATSEKITIAANCLDLKIIFARGSGGKRWENQDYQAFKSELIEKLKLIDLTYEFEDLDYPAIGVNDSFVLISTFVGRGEAYDFGASVNLGVKNLLNKINNSTCKNTKYVIAGYSQGAMVVSKAIQVLSPHKIIYAATFGDPKIYLPEGKGPVPTACSGKNLSNYRIYVPDCRVYEGMLGSYRPYQPEGYTDKLGTWCNKTDIFCSTHFSMDAHTSYVSDGLYADASKVIFDKICQAFGIENKYVSLHDTAILIDSTGSMQNLINKYKTEALNLAKKTFENGGRVALYDYRDLDDPYEPVEHCNFETCTLESFEAGLDKIVADGGGDIKESLLSASFKMMKKLNWNYGSTKSVVVLTDASYHSPDLDGVSFADVVALSKKIDPVNFYIITPRDTMDDYNELAEATGGAVVNSSSDLTVLTTGIMARYDSLPRVEEDDADVALPEITDVSFEIVSDSSAKISWSNTSAKTIVILNDYILGITASDFITINDLDLKTENTVTLVPVDGETRGMGVSKKLVDGWGALEIKIPKAPDTGRR